jgi:adenosylcobinamide kinase/adenosylcobinamide-phosphate guanylyltransferase
LNIQGKNMPNRLQLIMGGARSGKSRMAEKRVADSGLNRIYLATATAGDGEMSERIKKHQADRDGHWQLLEEPLDLAQTLREYSSFDNCILVDCLTLWLSNCLHNSCWLEQQQALLDSIEQLPGEVIFVTNEVGQGIVPMGELTRQFVDEAGFLHQRLAAVCDRVTMVTAGLPQELKVPVK